MDAVILAAGKGERLNGIMPRFWKPLLVVNGEPLIRRAVRQAYEAGAHEVTIVVAPENAQPISDVLDGFGDVNLIVQRKPHGPGHALLIGMKLIPDDNEHVLVLMGDNVSQDDDVNAIASAVPYGIGVRPIDLRNDGIRLSAARFTRVTADGENWVEKTPIPNVEDTITAWVGPITVKPILCRQHLKFDTTMNEVPIGPKLAKISPMAKLIHCTSIDIGTPAAVAGVHE